MHFLITWTTHGYWIPGDPRGFRTYRDRQEVPPPERFAASGERHYHPRSYEKLYASRKRDSSTAVRLDETHMRAAAKVIAEVASGLDATGIVAVGPYHVHVLPNLRESLTTGFFCNRVKSKSSLRLSDYGLKGKVWARRYHARRVEDEDCGKVHRYVSSHANHGAVVIQF